VVVLPILPEGPLERFGGIRPRQLWLFVLFFSGISFIGYLARRAIGSAQGYAWAGLLGGLVSSTAVTFRFARLSRSEPMLSRPLAIGALGASTVLFPRVLVAVVVLNRDVARIVAVLTAAAFALGAVLFIWYLRHSRSEVADVEGSRNP